MSEDFINDAKSLADTWPELIPLDLPELPRIDERSLPDWAGNFARALSRSTETPRELPLSMVLAACSVAIARRLSVEVAPGYVEPCNLWLVTALPPGNRKSAVQKACVAPLIEWERTQSEIAEPEIKKVESHRKTVEVKIREIRSKSAKEKDTFKSESLGREAAELEASLPDVPLVPQLWTSDATPERLGSLLADQNECMAWLSSEAGIFELLQGRYSGGIPNLDLVLKAHSGDAERVDRGSRPPVILYEPKLTIGLSPQPEVLRGLAAKPGFRGRGLLARFLYLLPPSPLGFRTLDSDPIPQQIREEYSAALKSMLSWNATNNKSGRETTHKLNLSILAQELLREFSLEIESKMRPGGALEHFTDWAGKAPGAAARLAGVIHGIKHAFGEPWMAAITDETASQAITLMNVYFDHSLAAFSIMGADPEITQAQSIWRWFLRHKKKHATERDIFNALRSQFKTAASLKDPLNILTERGYVRRIELDKEGPGRKPSPLIIVRPEFTEGFSEYRQ